MLLLLALACAPSPLPSRRFDDPAPAPAPTSSTSSVQTTGTTPTTPSSTESVDTGADGGCYIDSWGVDGECLSVDDCAALGDHTSVAGYCPGPADVQCCTDSPDIYDNPPVPDGWHLMAQADVTAEMTDWAVEILYDGVTYPMFSVTIRSFDGTDTLARVEWHAPDFLNEAIHRGVTLYQQ